jgi:hypothetical protein
MSSHPLAAPVSPLGYPTPFWFIELFKVLGFSLHVAPMNLWYAGTVVAVLLGAFGRSHARTAGDHIARALPFALAFGINFGIIPLLFMQVAYYQFFYPATVLMAWPWFLVFWMVMVGYFAAYLYKLALEGRVPALWGRRSGWLAAGIFIVVGFLFANALSLMAGPARWWGIFRGANIAGAATGLAINWGDPTLIPRWLFMFALALTTTAVFVLLDAAFLSGRDEESYRCYARRLAFALYTLGLALFVGFGSWYIFGTRSFALPMALRNPVMRIVFPLTMVSPGLPWLLLLLQLKSPTRKLAWLTGLSQFAVIVLNATSRQWLQNVELGRYANLAARPVELQLVALIVFLVMFVAGIGLIAWMAGKAIQANRTEFQTLSSQR